MCDVHVLHARKEFRREFISAIAKNRTRSAIGSSRVLRSRFSAVCLSITTKCYNTVVPSCLSS
jgi:hypothetical protein